MESANIKSFLGVNELKNYKVLLKQLFSEFCSTFLYMSLVLLAGSSMDGDVTVVIIALSNGLMISTLVSIFGPISGCHLNPAVTIGVMVCDHIKPLRALCYIAVQIAGGIIGAAVAYALSSDSLRGNLNATVPHKDSRADQIFILEVMMTFLLILVILSVIDRKRGARGLGSAALAIGFCVSACLCSCLPYTASMNPVRSLGPAIIMGEWSLHWVYWAAPILGGLLAGVVYRFLLTIDTYEE